MCFAANLSFKLMTVTSIGHFFRVNPAKRFISMIIRLRTIEITAWTGKNTTFCHLLTESPTTINLLEEIPKSPSMQVKSSSKWGGLK